MRGWWGGGGGSERKKENKKKETEKSLDKIELIFHKLTIIMLLLLGTDVLTFVKSEADVS